MGYHITFSKLILILWDSQVISDCVKQLTLGTDFSSFSNEALVTGISISGNIRVQIYYCLMQDACLSLIFSLIKLKIHLFSLQLYMSLISSKSMKMWASNLDQKDGNKKNNKNQCTLTFTCSRPYARYVNYFINTYNDPTTQVLFLLSIYRRINQCTEKLNSQLDLFSSIQFSRCLLCVRSLTFAMSYRTEILNSQSMNVPSGQEIVSFKTS